MIALTVPNNGVVLSPGDSTPGPRWMMTWPGDWAGGGKAEMALV